MSTAPESVTLITGASSGIGWDLAKELARRGQSVGLAARRREPLVALSEEIRVAGGRAVALPCDVSDREQVFDAVARCRSELGPIDRLVANAGIGSPTPALRFRGRTVERIFATNLLGLAYAFEAVLPEMLARRQGHLVGVSSIAAWQGVPTSGGYSASKAAVSNLLDALRVELKPHGIAVTTICPGFVATPMTAQNDVPMPFMLTAPEAARRMARAIEARRARYAFPWQLVCLARLGQWLPTFVSDWILGRLLTQSPLPSAEEEG